MAKAQNLTNWNRTGRGAVATHEAAHAVAYAAANDYGELFSIKVRTDGRSGFMKHDRRTSGGLAGCAVCIIAGPIMEWLALGMPVTMPQEVVAGWRTDNSRFAKIASTHPTDKVWSPDIRTKADRFMFTYQKETGYRVRQSNGARAAIERAIAILENKDNRAIVISLAREFETVSGIQKKKLRAYCATVVKM